VLVAASGRWYVLARCRRSAEVRAFRLDRIVALTLGEERFEVPEDFDPRSHLSEGRVFRAEEEIEVRVRYSARIARWIVEKGPAEPAEDGSVQVRHRVADPRWVVRHVLQYGADAEVIAPPELRALVRDAVARVRD
jgi:predicted DNA-binding transcriptional regulator YafY